MAEKTDVAKNATTTDTVGKTSNPRLKDGSEVVTTSALLAKPLVKTTGSSIIITGLPVVSKEELENSTFRRICHALKYRFVDNEYTKHDAFIKRLNHGKDIRRPKGMPPISICYMLSFSYVANEPAPQLVITFLASVSYPSAHIKCAASDPYCDYRTGLFEKPVYWRPLPRIAVDNIVKLFSNYCALLMRRRIDLVWENTPLGRTPDFF